MRRVRTRPAGALPAGALPAVLALTTAGMDRGVVSVEDGVLLNYGPRTDQVPKSVAEQLHKKDGEA